MEVEFHGFMGYNHVHWTHNVKSMLCMGELVLCQPFDVTSWQYKQIAKMIK